MSGKNIQYKQENTSGSEVPAVGIIDIKATNYTPAIYFNPESGELNIKGHMLDENIYALFNPILFAIDRYISNPFLLTKITIELEYFNPLSSKLLLDIFSKYQYLHLQGKKVEIQWKYNNTDSDMKNAGLAFAEITDVPFKLVAK
jgi:hypothetical protein